MQKSIVRKIYSLCVLLLCFGLLPGMAHAVTFHLTDGTTVTGDTVSMDDTGIVLKRPDGSYADRLPWGKISQPDLKDLQQNDPKAADLVGPFLEESTAEKKPVVIEIKDVARPARPKGYSLLGAMFTSALGLFVLVVLYAGNIYAGYEVSIFRAQPAGLVCGVSAVAPVLGPIIFLAMPTKVKPRAVDWHTHADDQLEPGIAAAVAAEQGGTPVLAGADGNPEPEAYAAAPAPPPKPSLPPTKTYARGQFTFNRRFFETQLPQYFAMTRPESEKDKVLTFKSARGTYIAQRISRISANELHLQVQKGPASEEVIIPFVEVQEVELKHKDA